jgi:lysyl-tRNA synthetase class II
MDSSGEATAAPEASAPEGKRDFVAEERAQRIAKQERLTARTGQAYRFDRDLAEIRDEFGELDPGRETETAVRVAGRIRLIRRHGGLVFADLEDQTATVQLVFACDTLDDGAFGDLADLDRGDWIGAEATPMRTRMGELSLRVRDWALLTKCLRALPDKHRGLADVDTRLRQRYLDLIANPTTRRTFDIRSAVINSVRRVLGERGFTEVETPVLDAAAGGAAARPFITHHNALDIDRYMRIALELPLKRLVVGGFDRVFEIGRVFRNEGLDTRHNPLVHAARGLPGAGGLSRHDGSGRVHLLRGGEGAGQRDRPVPALAERADGRPHRAGARRAHASLDAARGGARSATGWACPTSRSGAVAA